MNQRTIEGVGAIDFPTQLVGNPLFAWMGEDYVAFIISELRARLAQQDETSCLSSTKCKSFPLVEVKTRADHKVHEVVLVFALELIVQKVGTRWRLQSDVMFRASGLDQPSAATVTVTIEVETYEEVRGSC